MGLPAAGRRRMSWPWGPMGSPTSRQPLSSSSKPVNQMWLSSIRLPAWKRCVFDLMHCASRGCNRKPHDSAASLPLCRCWTGADCLPY